jgi:hypothetical protein
MATGVVPGLSGCDGHPDLAPTRAATGSGGAPGKEQDAPTSPDRPYPTFNENLTMLGGFNTLFEKNLAQCVVRDPAFSGPQLTIGDVAEDFEILYVGKREDLAREIGVDLGLNVKYASVVDANAGFNLLNSFKQSSNSVGILLKVRQQYTVSGHGPALLTPEALGRLKNPDEFLAHCGNNYINGIQYEAQLHVLVRFDASSQETANTIKANLGVSGAIGPVPIGGNVQAHFTDTAARDDVSTFVAVASRGFLFSGQPASSTLLSTLLGSSVTKDMFDKIDAIRTQMGASVQLDACHDAGQGNCSDGRVGPGYNANAVRYSKPTGVLLGFYDSVQNAPYTTDGPNPFDTARNRLDGVEHYVRRFTDLQNRLADVYRDELAPFLGASTGAKYLYQVAPPAAPVATLPELQSQANLWAQRFLPDDGVHVGSSAQGLHDLIVGCWNAASLGRYDRCVLPAGTDPEDTAAYQQAAADLQLYAQTSRILPLQLIQAATTDTYDQAGDFCRSQSSDGQIYRLPHGVDEVGTLALAVAGSSLLNGAGGIWFDGDPCDGWPARHQVFSNTAGVGPTSSCQGDFWGSNYTAFCVSQLGPFGQIDGL